MSEHDDKSLHRRVEQMQKDIQTLHKRTDILKTDINNSRGSQLEVNAANRVNWEFVSSTVNFKLKQHEHQLHNILTKQLPDTVAHLTNISKLVVDQETKLDQYFKEVTSRLDQLFKTKSPAFDLQPNAPESPISKDLECHCGRNWKISLKRSTNCTNDYIIVTQDSQITLQEVIETSEASKDVYDKSQKKNKKAVKTAFDIEMINLKNVKLQGGFVSLTSDNGAWLFKRDNAGTDMLTDIVWQNIAKGSPSLSGSMICSSPVVLPAYLGGFCVQLGISPWSKQGNMKRFKIKVALVDFKYNEKRVNEHGFPVKFSIKIVMVTLRGDLTTPDIIQFSLDKFSVGFEGSSPACLNDYVDTQRFPQFIHIKFLPYES